MLLCVMLLSGLSLASGAETTGVYPESAVLQAQKEELEEMRRLDEAKISAARFAQEYEQNKEEAEREIRAKRRNIEDLKIAQESLQRDQEFLKADLAEVQNKRKLVQKRYQDLLAKINKQTEARGDLRKEIDKNKEALKQDQLALNALEKESAPPKTSPTATVEDLHQESRWTFTEDCVAFAAPDESAKVVGKFQKSKFVFGKASGDYVKVPSASGAPLFISKKCMKESVNK